MEKCCVFFEVGTDFLNIIHISWMFLNDEHGKETFEARRSYKQQLNIQSVPQRKHNASPVRLQMTMPNSV
jgi:hypothetical protein